MGPDTACSGTGRKSPAGEVSGTMAAPHVTCTGLPLPGGQGPGAAAGLRKRRYAFCTLTSHRSARLGSAPRDPGCPRAVAAQGATRRLTLPRAPLLRKRAARGVSHGRSRAPCFGVSPTDAAQHPVSRSYPLSGSAPPVPKCVPFLGLRGPQDAGRWPEQSPTLRFALRPSGASLELSTRRRAFSFPA